jgi:radical SAM superfamily enzyme YgiQ (UPF0313 family)
MKKALLVFPPFSTYAFGREFRRVESLTPPLGLLHLAAPLVEHGYEVTLLDLCIDHIERAQFEGMVRRHDYVLVSCYTQSIENAHEIIRDVRKINGRAFILCGGPYCMETQRYVPGSDITAVAEADKTIVAMLEGLEGERPLEGIPNLFFRRNGRVIRTERDHSINPFCEGDYPRLELVRDKDYGYFHGVKIPGVAPLLSSRGCPFRCSFCTYNLTRYRQRDVADVIAEIELRERQGYRYIIFCDDNFLLQKQRAHRIMDGIIARGIKMRMIMQGRVNAPDLELYRKMRRAGVELVIFGLESANPDVLEYFNKRATVEEGCRAVELADRAGLLVAGSLIIGAPMETRAHVARNKRFVDQLPLDFLNVNVLAYFYNARIWKDARAKGLIGEDELFVLANESLSHFSYAEWRAFEQEILAGFYSNPRRVARILYKMVRMRDLHLLRMIVGQTFARATHRSGGNRFGFMEKNVRLPPPEGEAAPLRAASAGSG